jgi:hypothetical protein
MDTEIRVKEVTSVVYWVTDPNGVRHLFHDRLASQLIEERWQREIKEKEKNASTL